MFENSDFKSLCDYLMFAVRCSMGITYKKLWIRMAEMEMKRTELKEFAGISSNTLAKLGKNEYVSLEIIERICRKFNCEIGEIVELSNEDKMEAR